MTDHTTTIISVAYAWTEAGQQFGYRGTCSCGWKGRKFPLSQQELVKAQVADHRRYVTDVSRRTAPRATGLGGGEG